MENIENICVYGVGGVGGYFGGMLCHGLLKPAGKGPKIFFIARGEHLKAIRSFGLILNTSLLGRLVATPDLATDRIEDIPAPDLCFLCVKSYDLPDAVARLAGNMKPGTVVLPLLNGVDIYERTREVLKTGTVLPSCVYVGTHIDAPGTVTQKGGDGIILSGKDPGVTGFDPGKLIALFRDAGIKFSWNDDPYPAIWEKYMFIAAFGLVTACTHKTLGEVARDQILRKLVEEIMGEIKNIAYAKHIALKDDIIEASLGKASNFPFETRTSYQRDMETKGAGNEGDLFGGTILKLGGSLGIPTPVTERVYSSIEQMRPNPKV